MNYVYAHVSNTEVIARRKAKSWGSIISAFLCSRCNRRVVFPKPLGRLMKTALADQQARGYRIGNGFVHGAKTDCTATDEGPVVSGLETAIRNALEKSDRSNPEVRARIYQSSRQALEAGLRKQNIDDPKVIAQQRQRLEILIHGIENEERNRLLDVVEAHVKRETTPPGAAPSVSSSRADESVHSVARAPEVHSANTPSHSDVDDEYDDEAEDDFRAERQERRGLGSAVSPSADATLAFRPEASARPRKRRRGLFARLFMLVTVFAFLGVGIWWVYTSGLLLTAEQRDTSVPNPPAEVQAEDFHGNVAEPAIDPGRGFSDDWVDIYQAESNNAGITPGSLASVETVATPAGPASRVTSRSVGDDGNVSIEVPAAVLQELAGKSSTVAVTLQSSTDRQTQVSISCDFASLGDCSRHRFVATPERADMLFKVNFERTLAPNSPGHLMINSDIDGNGRPINVYSVRILPGQ